MGGKATQMSTSTIYKSMYIYLKVSLKPNNIYNVICRYRQILEISTKRK